MTERKIICMAVDDEAPALAVLTKYIRSVHTLELATTCTDAVEAINYLQEHAVDLLFQDIKMPELLGTDLIRSLKHPPKVIFTTAYRKYALEGFELEAVDFLLKPISFERFLRAVNKMTNGMTDKKMQSGGTEAANAFICLRSNRKMVKILFDDIFFIESIKDYVKVHTATGAILSKQSISNVEAGLPKEKFIRIHRSFIVSLAKIQSYNHELIWIGKNELPISRMYRHEVEQFLGNR